LWLASINIRLPGDASPQYGDVHLPAFAELRQWITPNARPIAVTIGQSITITYSYAAASNQ